MAEEAKPSDSQSPSSVSEEKNSIQHAKTLYDTLQSNDKVNLFGPRGVGKTRIAKRVSERVIRESIAQNVVQFALWVFMCIEYTKESLARSIARQLCLLPTVEEWEVEDDNKEEKGDDHDEVAKTETLVENIQKKIKGNKILLFLDDAVDGKNEKENKFWLYWDLIASYLDVKLKTVIISRLRREDEGYIAVEVKAFPSVDYSYSLLREKLDTRLKQYEKIQTLGKNLIEKMDERSPSKVTILAKALNYFGVDASQVSILEKELEEASKDYTISKLLCMKHDVLPIGVLKDLWWRGPHFFRDSGSVHYSELITYWILEGYLGNHSMTKLYKKGHGVLMELIDCGVLKVQEGGYVFMDRSLINIDDLYQCVDQTPNLGLATLFTLDGECFGKITYEEGMLKTPRSRKKPPPPPSSTSPPPPSSTSPPPPSSTSPPPPPPPPSSSSAAPPPLLPPPPPSSDDKKSGQNLTTLLLDGTHFTEKSMLDFLEPEKKLQVLALFNPTIKSLPQTLGTMESLRVLVLRGCEFLHDLRISLPLKSLNVLEISGARSLRALRSVLFKNMLNLKSLHLSGLQISILPAAIYNLHKLQWLIVKNCPRLKKLDSISKLEDLMVVDLSGNLALETVDKNFLKFNKLQTLNLSKTRVSTTPLLKNIKELTHLFVRGCSNLDRLRGLTSLTTLQTIDLSGSEKFEEFHDSSLESLRSLRKLDLSATALERLPSNISKPRELYLKSCMNLIRLPCIESVENLEVLDLSGSKNLNKIDDKFFDQMQRLRVLNLSETNIPKLPSLSDLLNLRELILSCCKSLTHLPSLENSTKLEILDISNCDVLESIENDSFNFKSMNRLQKLVFSDTKIKLFPPLPNPCNLTHLVLKNCTNLNNLDLNVSFPNLEELNLSGVTSFENAEFVKDITTLKILDFSHTSIKNLPSISKLTNLTHLSLAGCSLKDSDLDLDASSKLEVLDLSKTSIKRLRLPNLNNPNNLKKLVLESCSIEEGFPDVKFDDYPNLPDDISRFSHLDYFEFPNIKVDNKQEDQWNVCELSDVDKPPVFLNGTQFLQHFKQNESKSGPYHLCVIPVKKEDLQRNELVFRDVYFQTNQFSEYKTKKSLQIRGFNCFPNDLENIISKVDLVFLIDYKLKGLPSGFNFSTLSNLKGCWIERCDKMDTIFNETEGNENENTNNLDFPFENLGICNNRGLKSIYNGKQPAFGKCFDSLKSLYLDTCPEITTVFPSSWLPKNLEVVHVKHCKKIVSLFESGGQLPNLKTLILFELPELTDIDNVSFPCLEILKIWECPKVKQLEDVFGIPRGLKTLWICGAPRLKSLEYLYGTGDECFECIKLESCPMLEYVFSKTTRLEKIKMMEIRSCEKLKNLFLESMDYLPPIETRILEDLPMLK